MKYVAVRRSDIVSLVAIILVIGAQTATHAQAVDVYRPTVPTPGGIDSRPVITSLTPLGTNVTVHFRGLQAPYHAEMSPDNSNWTNSTPTALRWPRFTGSVIVSNVPLGTNAFFRINMHGHSFEGAKCYGCHTEVINDWMKTPHATAINALRDANGTIPASNLNCVVCHSVGWGQPGGFIDLATTPQLANVGCESCHGPGGPHLNLGSTRIYRPAATPAAEVCGGCHTHPDHPTYDEWTNSPHAQVTAQVGNAIDGMANPTNGFARQMSCGPCHSGATRLAMLADLQDRKYGYTNALILPSPGDSGHFAQTCVVCHDPHATNVGPHQVRNPIFSTNFYAYTGGTDARTNIGTNVFGVPTTNIVYMNTAFATQYVANVQICAQCHNHRGAVWTATSRPPHYSPQYNVLMGAIQPGYLNGLTNYFHIHSLNTNGCVQCHMHQETVSTPTDLAPNNTGHRFRYNVNGCLIEGCHIDPDEAIFFMNAVQLDTTNRVRELVTLLNRWGTNRAPDVLRTNYGKYSWEYATAGELSNPTGTNTVTGSTNVIAGPPVSLQSFVPDDIKKARYNLYLIQHDGSKGVHNVDFSRFLLRDARTNVLRQLQ